MELPLLDSLSQVVASGDLDTAAQLAKTLWFDGRKKLQPAHEASARLATFHGQVKAAGSDAPLAALHNRLVGQSATERDELSKVLGSLGLLRNDSADLLLDAVHMPVTRSGVLTSSEDTAMRSLIQVVDAHAPFGQHLLDPAMCSAGSCETSHSSARLLRDVEREATSSSLNATVSAARKRVDTQLVAERRRVRTLREQSERWPGRVQEIREVRTKALRNVEATVKKALAAVIEVKADGTVCLAPLASTDAELIPNLELLATFVLTPSDDAALAEATALAKSVKERITRCSTASGSVRATGGASLGTTRPPTSWPRHRRLKPTFRSSRLQQSRDAPS